MQYKIFNGQNEVKTTSGKSAVITGLTPKTNYTFYVSAHNGLRESTKASVNFTTRGLYFEIDKELKVGDEVELEYVEYPFGVVPIGTEPAGMFGGGNKQVLKGSVISVFGGKSVVELKSSFNKLSDSLKLAANLPVIGLNLVANSSNFKSLSGWTNTNTVGQPYLGTHPYWKNGTEKMLIISNKSATKEVTVGSDRFRVKPNTNYTVSFSGFHNSALKNYDVYFLARKHTSNADFEKSILPIQGQKLSISGVVNKSATFNTGDFDEGYIRFDNNASNQEGVSADLYLANIKVEEGSQATPWSPARKDVYGTDQVFSGFSAFDGYKAIYYDK